MATSSQEPIFVLRVFFFFLLKLFFHQGWRADTVYMIWLLGAGICQQKKGRQQEKVSCKLSISKLLVHLTLANSEATCSAISHQVKMKLSLNQDSDIYRKLKREKIREKEILLN